MLTLKSNMDHMKYPCVPELTKVTRIERIHVEMDDQVSNKTTLNVFKLLCTVLHVMSREIPTRSFALFLL